MPKCMDRGAKALSDQGYNLVKYPRSGISPLDVLARADGRFEWLGPFTTIWQGSTAAPTPKQSNVPQFTYQSSNEYRGAFGLQILDGLLKNFGGSAGATVSRKSKLTFSFKDPKCDVIAPVDVGAYLKDGDIDFANPFLKAFLGRENPLESDFYVVTEVLRSKQLSVTLENDNAAELKADAEALGKLAKANGSLDVAGKSAKEIVYDGDTLLTFAFKAFEVAHDNGEWRVLGVAAPGFLRASAGTGVILDEGAPVDVVQLT